MSLAPTRKREKQIKKLRKQAEKLWDVQRGVNTRAGELAREAAEQAGAYGRESVVPEARRYAQRGISGGRNALSGVTRGWNKTVVPAIAGGIGSFAAMAQISKDQRVKDAIANVERYARVPEVAPAKQAKRGPSAGQWVLIGIGTVAVVGAAYAAWQTLRADDDLWIPDTDEIEPTPSQTV